MPTETDKSMDMEDAVYTPKETSDVTQQPRTIDEEEAENPTALLPMKALGSGVKEGDTVTVRVVKLYGDEAEVEVVQGETEMPEEGEMMEENAELDSMDKG